MWHIVLQSQAKIEEAIKPLGLTPIEWRIIYTLYDFETVSIRELSKMILVEASVLSRMLQRLEKRKIIIKKKKNKDQRYVIVQLTSQGQKLYQEVIPIVIRQLNIAQANVSEADLQHLLSTLKTMTDNVYRSPFAFASS
jgi:DNA-binding MarR family transcriptional regulator